MLTSIAIDEFNPELPRNVIYAVCISTSTFERKEYPGRIR
jgi:hypothetical protein